MSIQDHDKNRRLQETIDSLTDPKPERIVCEACGGVGCGACNNGYVYFEPMTDPKPTDPRCHVCGLTQNEGKHIGNNYSDEGDRLTLHYFQAKPNDPLRELIANLRRWAEGSDDNPQGCKHWEHAHDCPCGVYDEVADLLESALAAHDGEVRAAAKLEVQNECVAIVRSKLQELKRDPSKSFALPYTPPTEQDMRDAKSFSEMLNSVLDIASSALIRDISHLELRAALTKPSESSAPRITAERYEELLAKSRVAALLSSDPRPKFPPRS